MAAETKTAEPVEPNVFIKLCLIFILAVVNCWKMFKQTGEAKPAGAEAWDEGEEEAPKTAGGDSGFMMFCKFIGELFLLVILIAVFAFVCFFLY